jgi:TetR/AcrR family transcriptional regulator, tetracycline repressor protein
VIGIDDTRLSVVRDHGGPSTAREPLDRERIVGEAVSFVDEHSLQQLTMRRLGQRLGVEAMSLYRYVDGREDLLDAMVQQTLEGLDVDPHLRLLPTDGWQAYLQRLAHGVRDIALAHPKVFPLVATRHPDAPWLRPPLRSLTLVEAFLEALIGRGFSDDAAVAAYRAFSSFLLGHLLLEVSALGAATAPAEEPLAEPTSGDDGNDVEEAGREQGRNESDERLAEFPHLRRLEDRLSRDDAQAEFEMSLESLLQRLELTLS